MSQTIELFSTLWHMALDFHEKYERWYNGPLKGLDPNEIQKMVEEMLENATKLAKVFSDTPSARRIAETMRSKIEKFRAYLPVLHTLCNSGMRDRHWDQISAANGVTHL
ncbi:DNAH [Lepeophtheirus salmonis]|uniref:DNAH n=1 Tax=Lepeophtheirus salmonis TaxID=72036 RepID=A0A7R8HD11_LEPSM|nr:DNAH [Lepeophtheirus salmonis]CAF3025418.1 DNAH [Lepeophtheirus salmonis]